MDFELTTSEVAKLCGVSEKTIRMWEEKGHLTCEKTVGGHRRYSLENVRKLQSEQKDIRDCSVFDEWNLKENSNKTDKVDYDIMKEWWRNKGHLNDIKEEEKSDVACILNNLMNNFISLNDFVPDKFINFNEEIWNKNFFKNYISIQVMTGTCSLIFYTKPIEINEGDDSELALVAESKAVSYDVFEFKHVILPEIDFSVYSKYFSMDIDYFIADFILNNICKKIVTISDLKNKIEDENYDYILTDNSLLINFLKHNYKESLKIENNGVVSGYYKNKPIILNETCSKNNLNANIFLGKKNQTRIGESGFIFIPYILAFPIANKLNYSECSMIGKFSMFYNRDMKLNSYLVEDFSEHLFDK